MSNTTQFSAPTSPEILDKVGRTVFKSASDVFRSVGTAVMMSTEPGREYKNAQRFFYATGVPAFAYFTYRNISMNKMSALIEDAPELLKDHLMTKEAYNIVKGEKVGLEKNLLNTDYSRPEQYEQLARELRVFKKKYEKNWDNFDKDFTEKYDKILKVTETNQKNLLFLKGSASKTLKNATKYFSKKLLPGEDQQAFRKTIDATVEVRQLYKRLSATARRLDKIAKEVLRKRAAEKAAKEAERAAREAAKAAARAAKQAAKKGGQLALKGGTEAAKVAAESTALTTAAGSTTAVSTTAVGSTTAAGGAGAGAAASGPIGWLIILIVVLVVVVLMILAVFMYFGGAFELEAKREREMGSSEQTTEQTEYDDGKKSANEIFKEGYTFVQKFDEEWLEKYDIELLKDPDKRFTNPHEVNYNKDVLGYFDPVTGEKAIINDWSGVQIDGWNNFGDPVFTNNNREKVEFSSHNTKDIFTLSFFFFKMQLKEYPLTTRDYIESLWHDSHVTQHFVSDVYECKDLNCKSFVASYKCTDAEYYEWFNTSEIHTNSSLVPYSEEGCQTYYHTSDSMNGCTNYTTVSVTTVDTSTCDDYSVDGNGNLHCNHGGAHTTTITYKVCLGHKYCPGHEATIDYCTGHVDLVSQTIEYYIGKSKTRDNHEEKGVMSIYEIDTFAKEYESEPSSTIYEGENFDFSGWKLVSYVNDFNPSIMNSDWEKRFDIVDERELVDPIDPSEMRKRIMTQFVNLPSE